MKHILYTVFLSIFLISPLVQAEVFQYRDQEGRTHYTSSIMAIPEQYRDQARQPAKLPTVNRLEFLDEKAELSGADSARSTPEVEIYVTSWCGHCTRLENYLRRHNIRFTRYDIERSAEGKRRYAALRGRGVPLVKIGSELIRGFQPREIERLLSQ